MEELIQIQKQEDGKQAVSARELYKFLELDPSQFARWASSNIEHNQFAEEGIDYQCLDIDVEMPNGGTVKRKDAALSIPFAKKLCMLSNSAKGEQARDYFIKCEEKLKEVVKPKTTLDLFRHTLEALEEQHHRLDHVENRLDGTTNLLMQHQEKFDAMECEDPNAFSKSRKMTIKDYARSKGIPIPENAKKGIGKAVKTYCEKMEIDFTYCETGSYYQEWVIDHILKTKYPKYLQPLLEPSPLSPLYPFTPSPLDPEYLAIVQYATKYDINVRKDDEKALGATARGLCMAAQPHIPMNINGKWKSPSGMYVNTYREDILHETFTRRGYVF